MPSRLEATIPCVGPDKSYHHAAERRQERPVSRSRGSAADLEGVEHFKLADFDAQSDVSISAREPSSCHHYDGR